MLGTFQQIYLRLEIEATATEVSRSLLHAEAFQAWLRPQFFSQPLPTKLEPGSVYRSGFGPLQIRHQVESTNDHYLRLLLSGGVDGVHEWCWGDGWVQSKLEGVSLLPLRLAHTWSLMQLRQFLKSQR